MIHGLQNKTFVKCGFEKLRCKGLAISLVTVFGVFGDADMKNVTLSLSSGDAVGFSPVPKRSRQAASPCAAALLAQAELQ